MDRALVAAVLWWAVVSVFGDLATRRGYIHDNQVRSDDSEFLMRSVLDCGRQCEVHATCSGFSHSTSPYVYSDATVTLPSVSGDLAARRGYIHGNQVRSDDSEFPVRSALDCGRQCEMHATCSGFSHSVALTTCQLHTQNNTGDITTPRNTMVYYARSDVLTAPPSPTTTTLPPPPTSTSTLPPTSSTSTLPPTTTTSTLPPLSSTTTLPPPSTSTSTLPPSTATTTLSPPSPSTTTLPPSSSTSTLPPTSSNSTLPPTTTTSTLPPSSSTTTVPPPPTSTTTLPPSSSTSTLTPTSSTSILPPTTTTSTLPPSSSTTTLPPPPTSTSTLPPTSSTSTQPPTTRTSTLPPSSSTTTLPPSSSTSTLPPTTSTSTLPPTTSTTTLPPTTTTSTAQPTTTTSPTEPPPATTVSTTPPATTISVPLECPLPNTQTPMQFPDGVNYSIAINNVVATRAASVTHCSNVMWQHDLARIDSAAKQNHIFSILTSCQYFRDATVSYWIDGLKNIVDQTWEFLDQSEMPMDDSAYWSPGQPSNVTGDECVIMSRTSGFRWENTDCWNQHGVICLKLA